MKGPAGAIALILALATAAPAVAGEARASFTVSVVVPARVTLSVLEQPSALEVSAADVERGYAEAVATYRVSHNDRRGYLLSLLPRRGLTREIEVQGLATALVMGDDPVELVQPGPPGSHPLALAFRFVLDPAVVVVDNDAVTD